MTEQQRTRRDRHLDLNDLNRDFAREKPPLAPPKKDLSGARGILNAIGIKALAIGLFFRWPLLCIAAALALAPDLIARRR